GIVALGVAVEYRLRHPPPAPVAKGPPVETVDLPDGARVVGAEATGDRLVVRIELAEGSQELIVVNLATGLPVSTVILRPQTRAP
ncbi:MAG TPA: hypothetical protein VNF99_19090, partial [Stellaceae bacterium]|nr:hypothetical protein [Stellaceae bacterium]